MAQQFSRPQEVIRWKEIQKYTGECRATIFRKMREGAYGRVVQTTVMAVIRDDFIKHWNSCIVKN